MSNHCLSMAAPSQHTALEARNYNGTWHDLEGVHVLRASSPSLSHRQQLIVRQDVTLGVMSLGVTTIDKVEFILY
jgi:hypothetical protein